MILLFSGYNQRAVISFLRCLKKLEIDRFSIVASSESDPILLTSYSSKVCYVRKAKELNRNEFFLAIKSLQLSDSEKILIIPSTEALNRFLLFNRKEFEEHNCIIPLVDVDLYKTISDKNSFWKLCNNHGLTVPKIVSLREGNFVPYVAKPRTYLSSKGDVFAPFLIGDLDDHKKFIKSHNLNDFDLQEFLIGESYYLLYYFTLNGVVIKFSQQNLIQQPNGKSILLAQPSFIHETLISDQYIDLLKSLNYRGLIMIELRKTNGKYYMIEANPRLWGPSQLLEDSGICFFDYFLFDYGYIKSLPKHTVNLDAKYCWSGGFKKSVFEDSDCVWLTRNKEELLNNFNKFLKFDIYNRKDTKQIYLDERVKNYDK